MATSNKTASGNQAFNIAVTKKAQIWANVTKPQAVIRPLTVVLCVSVAQNLVTKPQAVIRPLTLWLAHGSQSGLKALQWKIETLFIAKTAKMLTAAVFYRLRKK